MVTGSFFLDAEWLPLIFADAERRAIEELVRVIPRARIREAEVLFTGPGMVPLDEEFLAAAPRLQAIFHAGESATSFVTEASRARGIRVFVAVSREVGAQNLHRGAVIVEELQRYLATTSPVMAPITSEPAVANLPAAEKISAGEVEPAIARATPQSRPVVSSKPIPRPRQRVWWKRPSFLFVSIGLHVLFALLATVYIVSRTTTRPRPAFKSSGVSAPSRAIEHKVQMAKQRAAAEPPPSMKRVAVAGLAKINLPPVPEMPTLDNHQPSTLSSMSGAGVAGNLGGRGGGSGGGGQMGAGTGAAAVSFFGIRDASQSVVIMIDVSDSMFTRTGDAENGKLLKKGKDQSFQKVRDEAEKLVQSLPPRTLFGIIRWSGGAYSWQPELVPATDANKAAAIAHIENQVDLKSARPHKGQPGGTRHDYALQLVFTLKPEVIYMLTDGNATAAQPGGGLEPIPADELWKIAAEGQKTLAKPARLHVIYYIDGKDKEDERRMLRTLAARNGGKFRDFDAKAKPKSNSGPSPTPGLFSHPSPSPGY